MYTWFKAKDTLPHDSQNTHRIAISFASDYNMPWSIFMKYPEKGKELLTTSLDHSIWFYENVDFNQWHLFVQECVRSAHGRPLNISWLDIIFCTIGIFLPLQHLQRSRNTGSYCHAAVTGQSQALTANSTIIDIITFVLL